ncbi:ATP-binding protein [Persicobacter psychrovividus]|uniref:Histidine kinase/HSP90-like ATPase domain-containing protein n=1 Tax=Persicobacter psychrovividus TaxID=387638 RepID=A0ABM7VGG2_9BACT|nr:hypothetical protein PEPS_23120 [Persicobacter psychrovividus]
MEFRHKVSCSTNKLVELRGFVKHTLHTIGISDTMAYNLALAVDEVCANVMIHSHQCDAHDFIELTIRKKEGYIVFEIVDKHELGYDIENHQSVPVSILIEDKRKGGLGLQLVDKIMDRIEYFNLPPKHVYRLSKCI